MICRAKFLFLLPALVLLCGCADRSDTERRRSGSQGEGASSSIDQRSYRLGSIGAFAEMVGAGVKKLALSAPMTPQEMDALLEDAEGIAADHGVDLYLEADFLVTDLFSPELTDGKQVLLIYRGGTLEEYLALKAEKRRLVEETQYLDDRRLEIARRFGKLLSYTDEKIASLLAGTG